MNKLVLFTLAAITVSGISLAQAQNQPYEPPPADEPRPGLERGIEDGLQGFMENLLNEVQPHLDKLGRDLSDTVGSLAPVLNELGDLMDDAGNYQAPERLENGDILIRRRADAPPPPAVGDTLRELLAPRGSRLPERTPEFAPQPDRRDPDLPEIEL